MKIRYTVLVRQKGDYEIWCNAFSCEGTSMVDTLEEAVKVVCELQDATKALGDFDTQYTVMPVMEIEVPEIEVDWDDGEDSFN